MSELSSAEIDRALRDGGANLGIGRQVPIGFLGSPLVRVEHVAVTHAGHPIALAKRTVTKADLRRHVEIILRDSGSGPGYAEEFPARHHYWKVGSFDAAIEAVSAGLGYAWLPKHRIRQALASQTLVPVALDEQSAFSVSLFLIIRNSGADASPASRLAEALHRLAALREW